jgi:VWFA-related protein
MTQPQRRMMLAISGALAMSLFAVPHLALGQASVQNPKSQKSSNQTGAVIRTTSRLVLLDVVVTDKSGKAVLGLNKEDFTVFEDGQPQRISNFETPETHLSENATADTSPANRNQSAQHLSKQERADAALPETIIVLDDRNTSSEDAALAWQELLKYLRKQPDPLAEPTALMVFTKTRLERVAPPTRDTALLLAKAQKIQLELPSLSFNNGVQGAASGMLASLLALDEIALSSANRQSRKNIIWIGSGFPILSSTNVQMVDRDRFLSYVRYTANWLQETRSTIYTINPKGLPVANEGYLDLVGGGALIGSTIQPTTGELVFESLAPETGGQIFRNRNDINVAISDAVESGSAYYTLAYYPENSNFDGNFRKIRVAVDDNKFTATTQQGYYAVDEGFGATQSELDFALSRAVKSPLPFSSVEFDAVGKVLLGQPPTVRFSVSVDRDAVSWESQPNGDQRGELTLVTSEVSKKDSILDYKVREIELVVPKDKFEDPAVTHVLFSVTIPLPPKTDHFRFVLRDAASGRLGTYDVARQSLGQQIAANH